MPQRYQDEIRNTNWTALGEEANYFLRKTVLPEINSSLKTIAFTLPLGSYIKTPEIQNHDKFVLFLSDFMATKTAASGRQSSIAGSARTADFENRRASIIINN